MMDETLVSIIVPVYNVERYIQECIDSLRAQTYKNLEMILVDDGSSDQSGKICDAAAREDPRIRVFHQKNAGVAAARNLGISQASGAFICFCDSDDVCAPFSMELLLKAEQKYHGDVIVGDYREFEGTITFSPPTENPPDQLTGREAVCRLIGRDHVKYTTVNAKLFRTRLFEKIRFSEGKIHEDEEFAYRILYEAETVVDLHETIYGYRLAPNSITTSDYSPARLSAVEIARKRIEFFREKDEPYLCENFSWVYALMLLQHSERVRNTLKDPILARKMKKEFRTMVPGLLKGKHLSRKRKLMIAVFYLIPGQYAWLMGLREKTNRQ